MKSRQRTLLAVLATAAIAGVGYGVLAGDDSHSVASGASGDLHIALLSSAPSEGASRALPDTMAAGGYDVDGARQALTLPDGERLVVARRNDDRLGGGDLICGLTVAKDGGSHGGCTSIADFNAKGLASVSSSDAGVQLVGVVPDGVTQVTVDFADGTSKDVAVESNAYAVTSDVPTKAVSFDGPDGVATRALTTPPAEK